MGAANIAAAAAEAAKEESEVEENDEDEDDDVQRGEWRRNTLQKKRTASVSPKKTTKEWRMMLGW